MNIKKTASNLILIITALIAVNHNILMSRAHSDKYKITGIENIEPGSGVTCVIHLERKIIETGERFRNIVKIKGEAVKKNKKILSMRVDEVTSKNLHMKNGKWTRDKMHVKKPPYSPGRIYDFEEKTEVIDNPVSKGFHKIFFISEQ
jgi:hypothetical protein